MSHHIPFFFFFFFISSFPLTLSLPTIGVTYSATTTTTTTTTSLRPTPPAERVVAALQRLNIHSLRLEDSDPAITRSLLYTNTTVFLTIPNYMVTPMAQNRSVAQSWLYTHVVPFYPRVKITTISVGNAFADVYPESANDLLPAISNVHVSLRDIGIRKIAVSTSFSFVTALSSPFPPSTAQFQEPPGVTLFGPLLQFLQDTNSTFLVNLYPYNLYRLRPEIPLGIALFQEHPFNFRDDFTTGVRYKNLFDVMVDAVVSAIAVAGYETVPVTVTETGWPSASSSGNEFDANLGYAEVYLKGLVKHLKSGMGTPLLKDGVREVFVYEMFDIEVGGTGRSWGLLYHNGTPKYNVDFSSSSVNGVNFVVVIVFLLFLVTCFYYGD